MGGPSEPSVDVAIVNWNTSQAAIGAALGFEASEGVEARPTIADNASQPGERAVLEAQAGSISVVFNESNLGYGGAVNETLARGSGDFVCASNADLIPAPSMLTRLTDACRDPAVGLAGPVLEPDRPGYHAHLPRAAAFLIRPMVGSFGTRPVAVPSDGQIADVEQPAGACLVMSREHWERLGGFDPAFFLFYEDVDLARRSLDAGFRNVVVGAARARHVGAGAVSSWDPREHQRQRLLSLRRYVGKHHPLLSRPVNAATALGLRVRARNS
ncbi:glycosyltransferase family 2 protein [soil metagenome]